MLQVGKKKNMTAFFFFVKLKLLKATVMLVLTIWGTSAAAASHLVQKASGVCLSEFVSPKFSPHQLLLLLKMFFRSSVG